MILIDANIFMYAAGADHPHKQPSIEFLEHVATGAEDAAVDAETLQEILHRYRAIGRWLEGRAVFDLARKIVPNIVSIDATVLDLARELLDRHDEIMARDALHAAVVLEHGMEGIVSYDRDFDQIHRVRRIEPGKRG